MANVYCEIPVGYFFFKIISLGVAIFSLGKRGLHGFYTARVTTVSPVGYGLSGDISSSICYFFVFQGTVPRVECGVQVSVYFRAPSICGRCGSVGTLQIERLF